MDYPGGGLYKVVLRSGEIPNIDGGDLPRIPATTEAFDLDSRYLIFRNGERTPGSIEDRTLGNELMEDLTKP